LHTIYFVIGPHRSGTSLVTSLLAETVGVLPNNLMRPALSNQKGFQESWSVVNVNELILKEMGLKWDSPEPTNSEINKSSFKDKFKEDCKKCISSCFKDLNKNLVLKDPRFCKTFPVWRSVVKSMGFKMKIIIPVRKPLDVMKSLIKRDSFTPEHACLIWYWNILEAIVHTRGTNSKFIFYDELLNHSQQHFYEVLGIEISSETAKKIDCNLNHAREFVFDLNLNVEPFNSANALYERILKNTTPPQDLIDDLESKYFFSLSQKFFYNTKNKSKERYLLKLIKELNGVKVRESRLCMNQSLCYNSNSPSYYEIYLKNKNLESSFLSKIFRRLKILINNK
jgi:hypothetical protein